MTTMYNLCLVHRGMFSTSGGYLIMSTSGDTMSTSGGYHECIGGVRYIGGYHEYIDGFRY